MTDPGRGFGPGELPSNDDTLAESDADLARSLRMGRELEAMASRDAFSGSDDFAAVIAGVGSPGGATAIGAAALLRSDASPAPLIPSPSPEPEPSPSSSPDVVPSQSPTPSETPEPTETAEPGETPRPTG